MSDGIRGILQDMGKLPASGVPDTCRSWRCEPDGCICHLTAPVSTTPARNRLEGHPGASESERAPVPNDGAWMNRVNAVGNPPVAGTGPCPGCGGEYPPYYRHACEPVPDDGGGDDPDWPIPDDDPDEWVPDATGTSEAPEGCICGDRYKGRLFVPPPCPIHSGLVADTGYVDALDRLMP